MTGSVNPPGSSGERLSGMGVQPEDEGVILQRGGEELLLSKVSDRFTVRPQQGHSLNALAQQMAATTVRRVPTVQLFEFVVSPPTLEASMELARNSEDVAFASHVYCLHNSPATLVYLTDQITIQFGRQVTAAQIQAIATNLRLQSLQPVEGIPQTFVFEVTKQTRLNPIKVANQLMRYPEVLAAEPNIVIRSQDMYRPSDSEYINQWYLHHNGGPDLTPNSHIFVEQAWDITRGVRSVIVAVTDDAFDLNHPDFQGKGKIAFPKDFKDGGNLPLPETPQENHGTACAGVAIAEENGVGIVGVAPGCTLMPIRTTGFLDDQAIEQLFNYAVERGAAVISCSWGPSAVYFPLSLRQSAAITRAATRGRGGKGCVVVFAAGNANRPINGSVNEQGWPNNTLKGPTSWLSGFAVHPDVITVSASTSLNKKAAYSNWGNNISVAAPSNNAPPGIWLQQTGFIRTPPEMLPPFPGRGVVTSDRLGASGYDPDAYTTSFGGTSSATPVVAGVAALMLSVNPDLTAKEVKQLLQDTADKIVDSTPDPQLGTQGGTYDASGHSLWFGYGKVNAFKAVQAALQRLVPLGSVSRRIQQQNTTAVTIPDFNGQGVTSTIQINTDSQIVDVRVTVDVEHSFLGDLEISLIPPQGEAILLQSRTLGSRTTLRTTYTPQTSPPLRKLANQKATGRWQLRLVDHAPTHTGKLNGWQLDIGV